VFDDFLSFSDGVSLAATMHVSRLEMTAQQLEVAIQQAESEVHHVHNIEEALLSTKCDANDYEEVNAHFDPTTDYSGTGTDRRTELRERYTRPTPVLPMSNPMSKVSLLDRGKYNCLTIVCVFNSSLK
jgi:hypothetical protein